ncbi:hypothetical protein GQ55_8G181400 [Panicum hallii var. hallii]|uniref:Uncharacterized protein n=1 Tax=Panicum hallii var. hallii TaxID=1504633 RepID=A0A2T7CNN5_9POAL|nr:hypothetical protein GQ55_8G181400 [Panicum hallii var. hallii]
MPEHGFHTANHTFQIISAAFLDHLRSYIRGHQPTAGPAGIVVVVFLLRPSPAARVTAIIVSNQLDMAPVTATMATAVLVAALMLLAPPPPASAVGPLHQCDAMRDVVVTQSVGHRQSNGAKKFAVEVANRGGDAVSGIHLMCGYSFRTVWPVDPGIIVEVGHGDCLLVGGGSVAPGGTVSFNYTNYVRYDMTLLAATCDGGS